MVRLIAPFLLRQLARLNDLPHQQAVIIVLVAYVDNVGVESGKFNAPRRLKCPNLLDEDHGVQ